MDFGKAILSYGLLAVALYGAVAAAVYLGQRHLIYYPDTRSPARADHGAAAFGEVRLITADGLDLLAWHRPATEGRSTLLYLHGNAGHLGDRVFKVRTFIEAGLGVLLVSYRGYGGNPGRPSESGLIEDARAALAFLVGSGVPSARVVAYGESLGSGPAVALAAEADLGGLILEAPFSSLAEVAGYHFPWLPARWLIKDRFDSLARIGQVRAPLLVLHGGRDDTIPIRFGRKLHAAANEPKEINEFAMAGHNDLDAFGAGRAALDFLARHGK